MIKSRLETYLRFYNLDQKDLVAGTGINKNTISRYCTNTFEKIDKNHLDLLCSFFQCSLDDLFEVDTNLQVSYPSKGIQNMIESYKVMRTLTSATVINSETLQEETIDYVRPNKNIITGDDALNNAKEFEKENDYNPIPTDDQYYEMQIQQDRLNLEHDIEINLSIIIDNIISDAKNSTYYNEFKQEICNYSKTKELPLSLKLILLSMYRLIHTILTSQKNTELLGFLARMRNIYAHGTLLDLNDDDLIETFNSSEHYKFSSNVKKSYKILESIDIYNEYKTNKKD